MLLFLSLLVSTWGNPVMVSISDNTYPVEINGQELAVDTDDDGAAFDECLWL